MTRSDARSGEFHQGHKGVSASMVMLAGALTPPGDPIQILPAVFSNAPTVGASNMFGFGRAKDPTAAFWRWFEKNFAAIRRDVMTFGNKSRRIDLAVIVLGRKLKAVHPSLVHEIGMASETTLELIVSADGDKAAFGEVTTLISAAPRLDGFLLTAFRPRRPGLSIEIDGRSFGEPDVRYRARPDGHLLALELFVDCDLPDSDLWSAGYLLLHQALGEFDTESGVGALDIHRGAPDDTHPLSELAAEYDAFRNASVH